jgi:hypothetical protein
MEQTNHESGIDNLTEYGYPVEMMSIETCNLNDGSQSGVIKELTEKLTLAEKPESKSSHSLAHNLWHH